MAEITLTINIRRWWRWYCVVLVLVNHFTGWRPSDAAIERAARHALYVSEP